jgi:hypothetical protein
MPGFPPAAVIVTAMNDPSSDVLTIFKRDMDFLDPISRPCASTRPLARCIGERSLF